MIKKYYITNDTKRIFIEYSDKSIIEILPTENSYIKVLSGDFTAKYKFNDSPQFENYLMFYEDELLDKINESREYLNSLYKLADGLVNDLFLNVKDKGNNPYIEHLYFVANNTSDLRSKLVGLLHDTLEDTPLSYSDLKLAFGEDIAEAVDAMSKKNNESYSDYIKRVKSTYFSINTKLADLKHNQDTSRLNHELTDIDRQRLEKYKQAEINLTNYLNELQKKLTIY